MTASNDDALDEVLDTDWDPPQIVLSPEASARLLELVENPPPPTPALVELMARREK